MIQSKRLIPYSFFFCLFLYFLWLALAYSPIAHFEGDGLAMRDTGTMLPYLLSKDDSVKSLLVAFMVHIEGPLQFLVINLYCYLIGDRLPLTPATMAFPNVIFALATCLMILVVCKKLISERIAYCSVLAFALFPWLCFTMREPWYFNLLSCFLQLIVFYCYIEHLTRPESKVFRIIAPLSLSFYFFNCLDWSSFILCLVFFWLMLLRTNIVVLLRNPYNLIPVFCVLFMVVFSVAMTSKHGLWGLIQTRFIYPFYRIYTNTAGGYPRDIFDLTIFAGGAQWILAAAGALIYLLKDRRQGIYPELTRSFLDTMCFWFVTVGSVVIIAYGSPSFLYVVALPLAVLSGTALARIPSSLVLVPALLLMAGFQVNYNMDESHLYGFTADNRARVLAAACYLVEERPDLLSAAATPVATQGEAQAVIQYARPAKQYALILTQYNRLEIPLNTLSEGSRPHAFKFALDQFAKKGAQRPWIIMSTDVLRQDSQSFGRQLLDDPDISWFARFEDPNGEAIYLGEYTPGVSRPVSEAPSIDVPSLAKRWLSHYDRLRFLQRNVQFTRHY